MAWVRSQTILHKKTGYFYEGREISLEGKAGFPAKLARHKGNWWPQDKKLEAATVFAVTRNFEKTSLLVKIPIATLKRMAAEAWWGEIIAKVIKGKNEALDAKITDTLDKTLDLIQDRIMNGETYYNIKNDTQYKLPVKAKDAAIVTSILFDKRQLIRGEATTRSETITSEQKLLALKENFEKLAQSKQINPHSEPIEGEFLDAPILQEANDDSAIPPWEDDLNAKQQELQEGLQAGSSNGDPGEEASSVGEEFRPSRANEGRTR